MPSLRESNPCDLFNHSTRVWNPKLAWFYRCSMTKASRNGVLIIGRSSRSTFQHESDHFDDSADVNRKLPIIGFAGYCTTQKKLRTLPIFVHNVVPENATVWHIINSSTLVILRLEISEQIYQYDLDVNGGCWKICTITEGIQQYHNLEDGEIIHYVPTISPLHHSVADVNFCIVLRSFSYHR